MRKKDERGKLLYLGVMNRWKDTIKGQIKMFIKVCVFICIAFFVLYIVLLPGAHVGSRQYDYILRPMTIAAMLFVFFILFLVISIIGFELDRIYENGITTRNTSMLEKIRGKIFHPYKNIIKIGYGEHQFSDGRSEFIAVYENDTKKPAIPCFLKMYYKNDFYNRLIETLKNNCPNVSWEKVSWSEIPFSRKS